MCTRYEEPRWFTRNILTTASTPMHQIDYTTTLAEWEIQYKASTYINDSGRLVFISLEPKPFIPSELFEFEG